MKKIITSVLFFIIAAAVFLWTPGKAPVYAQTSSMLNIKHVFIILMENHDWSAITPSAAPYIWNTIIPSGAHANNYHNIPTALGSLHPSEPNYVFLEGGTNAYPDFTFTTDNNASLSNSTGSTAHLATLLNNSGKSWKAYEENMTAGTCPISSSGSYAAKHDPFVFFRDVSGNPPSTTNAYCIAHHSPLTTTILQNDLASGNVANYNFLTPNLCNDMHDCSVTTGDNWLKTFIPIIQASPLYQQDGAIFITWDEGGSGNNPIGMLILSPFAKVNYSSSTEYSHASTVKSIENIFSLTPYVGHAADSSVADLSEFFQGGTGPTPTPTSASVSTPTPTPTPKPTSTPTPSPVPNSTATPTPIASGTDPVITAAGDIACGSASTGALCQQQSTANLIKQINPSAVLDLGDNQYEAGSLSDFNTYYNPSWGAFKSITKPAVGNHEYGTAGAAGYFDYFNGTGSQTGIAGDRSQGYYSYDVGTWHLISLNTNCSQVGGCTAGTPQETWLKSDLAAHAGQCVLAYAHHPMFSSGQEPHNSGVDPLFTDLYNAHADLYLVGHDHDYERFYPSDPTGAQTPNGVTEFVVGTGGRNHLTLKTRQPNSAVFDQTTFGVLKLTLHPTGYDWNFLPSAGVNGYTNGTFTESGSAQCHTASGATPSPTPSAVTGFQPSFPIYATFFYNWFKNPATDGTGQWGVWSDSDALGIHTPPSNWFSNYLPAANLYSSNDYTNFKYEVSKLAEAKQEAVIASWWGQGDRSDAAFSNDIKIFMNRTDNPYPNLRWSLLYECEGNSCNGTSNPSVSQITSDLNYIATNYANQPGYLKVGGKPVLFVYADGTDAGTTNTSCNDTSMTARWRQANLAAATRFYLVLKVFPGYATDACQPDSWHQYAPAVRSDQQGSYSYMVSPGFWRSGDTVRLTRDISAFTSVVQSMVSANTAWKLTETWNEWGEGTAVEPGTQVIQANGTGTAVTDPNGATFGNAFVSALAAALPALPQGAGTVATPTPTPTAVPTSTATPASTATPVPTVAVATPTPTPCAGCTSSVVSLRSTSTGTNGKGATTLTIPTPAGVAAGDVMVAHVNVRPAGNVITPPPGWILVTRKDTDVVISTAAYMKVVSGTEPSSETWTFGTSGQANGGIAAYSGVNISSPIDGVSAQFNANTANVDNPGITTTTPGDKLVMLVGATASNTVTVPGGWTGHWAVTTATGTTMMDETDGNTGATGPFHTTDTTSTSSNVTILLGLRPNLSSATPTATTGPKPGDANGDGKVDETDYSIWLSHYGQTVTGGASVGDFDGNGRVDLVDYSIWLKNFGT